MDTLVEIGNTLLTGGSASGRGRVKTMGGEAEGVEEGRRRYH